MKQVYFDMKYADLKLRIATAQKAEETLRKHSKVKEAQAQYDLAQDLQEQLDELISRNTEVVTIEDTGVTFNG